ncbi:hypothetical protein GCM10009821_29560 [Aeromicrobium halocynthiae]|uniref:HTH cro/C1-type domain-containing protein n=1 Tax=Aeromicrobium halocynthiae TaxID=560557 RepID=A0ABN2WA33_9ACTN
MPAASKPPLSPATGEFGKRVRARRETLGLSQEGLAENSELHWSYIGQVERGQVNPTLRNILRIAEALAVDAGELVAKLPSE